MKPLPVIATLLLASAVHAQDAAYERAQALGERCARLAKDGQLALAEAACAEAVQLAPDLADVWATRGQVARSARRWNVAQDYLLRAVKLDPKHLAAHLELGELYLAAKVYPRAEAALKRALWIDPDNAYARYFLVHTYLRQDKVAEAQKQARALLATLPNAGAAQHAMGLVKWRQGDRLAASNYLSRAVELDSYAKADWWADLGSVLLELDRPDSALAAFRVCLTREPEHPTCRQQGEAAKRRLDAP